MNVTEEQISAMRARLKSRQEARRAEADIDQVISMVSKRRFPQKVPEPEAKAAAEPEAKMVSHEILTMARRMKLVEDVFWVGILAAWAVFSCLAFVSWRAGAGSPGAWLAAAEICLLPYLMKVPNDVRQPSVSRR